MSDAGEVDHQVKKQKFVEAQEVLEPLNKTQSTLTPARVTYKSGVLVIKWQIDHYKCLSCNAKNIGVFKVFQFLKVFCFTKLANFVYLEIN